MPKNGKGAGPSWKPDKSSTDGNYGQAVSEAAKAKPKPATPRSNKSKPLG